MSENLCEFVDARSREARSREACVRPAVGGLLFDYIAELLEDPAASEFEDHLLDCRCCRHEYLKLLSLRGAKGAAKATLDGEDARASDDANVGSIAVFRKE